MFCYRGDLHIPDADLWLDPKRRRKFAFISHAHGDHIGRHEHILATPATARILEHRLGEQNITLMPWGQTLTFGKVRLRAWPAGHILGSAQLEVESRGTKFVYSGDFRLKPSETAEPCQIVPCDILVMECTYGRPHYRFPPREGVIADLVQDIQRTLSEDATPILLAYTLGRGQELLKLLQPWGFDIRLAYPIYAMAKVYEELGIQFGKYSLAKPGATDGAVVFVPPHASRSKVVKRAKKPQRIAVTGWAMDGAQGPPYPTDRSYPLSDHADYGELFRYVTESRPKEVYTMHGFEEFHRHLREKGVAAYPVESRVAMQ